MHRSLIQHGLKQSFCTVAAPRGRSLCSSTTRLSHSTRQLNGGAGYSNQRRGPEKPEELSLTNLKLLESAKFQGFPHLEHAGGRQKEKDDDHGVVCSRSSSAGTASEADFCQRIENAGVQQNAHHKSDKPLDRGNNPTSSSEYSNEEEPGDRIELVPSVSPGPRAASNFLGGNTLRTQNGQEKTAVTERPYMRRLRKPKRFRELLLEARRSGADSTTSVDLNSGKPKKTVIRSGLTTAVLEAELRWIARNTPHPRAVRNILRVLLEERKIKPTLDHYEALILGQCFPEYGSIENVKLVLQEMERESVPLEVPILLAALTVLAVHPDTYLRASLVSRLAKQQLPIPDTHAHLNILSLIREGELELATVELEKLTQKSSFVGGGRDSTSVPKWLWTIYIHAICDLRHDFDALLQLLYRLSDSGFLFPRPTLLHLLLKASEHGDPHITKFIWYGYVTGMHIIPNEDMCMSVLRLAAREKDVKLAESVAVVLESVAGNKSTDPPSLVDQRPMSRQEVANLTFDSPELLGHEPEAEHHRQYSTCVGKDSDSDGDGDSDIQVSMSIADPTSGFSEPAQPPLRQTHTDLAIAFSTPPALPKPSDLPPRPRPLPAEALSLLAELGITGFEPTTDADTSSKRFRFRSGKLVESGGRTGRRRRRPVSGILYPLFREEAGLSGARFDPRLALMQGWDWRKK
ncbi:uncharacterized protein Z520_08055 [Fonsecaea multimorphosa CBS 102226]|uniref:Pentacotripeptide-repeat region of PRORP domain-containing protein n=1 Tax=Fonsecaea multimorphosa CBS 102226 TaxID=1442371 RepID=A0A0D2JS45_9EURO|nr:uncharacterized protein Z520_08055 [Fonsecaea multimorphosa CBS 102226]KIX96277.1 hypothetical protein Z520_08055 [Fonsecaea multimorphosa CBS 102226]OAL21939.1 hypothetical protein AYO22_07536 [Fonsecaea multimorphosa]